MLQYTRQDLRTDFVEIVKRTLKDSNLEANDELISVFLGAVKTALLETFQNDPSMMKFIVPIDTLAKKIT